MNVLLALGANQGDRLENLEHAAAELDTLAGAAIVKISSVFETQALTPKHAPIQWDTPFYNIAITLETTLDPTSLLDATQAIERQLGRRDSERWAPRPIDIDIIAYGHECVATDRLQIPHPEALKRAFVLAPCAEIDPERRLPGCSTTLLACKRELPLQLPAWMKIVNVTPDSFSGDGQLEVPVGEADLTNYIDLGAESTRPGASTVDPDDEWSRLEPALDHFVSTRHVRSKISVDTRNTSTARRALSMGADVINDVSGLEDDSMIDLLADASCDIVLMHSVSVPADPRQILADTADPVTEIRNWFTDRLEALDRRGINCTRMILDPGIGFGKSAEQSMQIIGRAREFCALGQRVLFGHSRKSYLQSMTDVPAAERDIETLAVSAHLADLGIDVLRVHADDLHRRFWRVHSRLHV